jgi:hypothetical protein
MPTVDRAAMTRDLAAASGPSVSVVCPLDHLSPGNPVDDQVLAELRDAAVARLEAYGDDRGSIDRVVHNLDAAFAAVDRAHAHRAVALFAGTDIAHVVPLELAVEPRIVVGERFALAELVTDTAREVHARVLVLSLAKTRCVDVTRRVVCEHHDAGFPIEVEAPTREETPHRDFALDEHEHEEAARYVLRAVDAALKKVHEADPRPIVLMGAERDLSYWDEVSTTPATVIGRVHGNYEWAGLSEIVARATPAFESHRRELEHAAASDAGEKLTKGAVCGISDVWPAARDGRGHRLVVEAGYHFNGRVETDQLSPAAADAPESFDAVDDAIREQVRHGGEVVVVDNEVLAGYGRIAMVLRY